MNPQRLERLLRLRRIEESEATRELGDRLQQVDAIEAQRARLEGYQREYLQVTLPESANELKWLAGMREQLSNALEQQDLRIQAAAARAEEARQGWLERHRNCKSLEKLLERHHAQALYHELHRQQHEQDLWATRQAYLDAAGETWQES